VIKSVALFVVPNQVDKLSSTFITVGNDPDNPMNNDECAGNIDRDGIYICTTLLSG
jgi:hypothetical protein